MLQELNDLIETLKEKELTLNTQIENEEKKNPQIIYICPITRTIMREPVVAPDGQSYEKQALLEWAKHCKDNHLPMTTPTSRVQFSENSLFLNQFYRDIVRSKFPIIEEIESIKKKIADLNITRSEVVSQSPIQQATPASALAQEPIATSVPSRSLRIPFLQGRNSFHRTAQNEAHDLMMKVLIIGDSSDGIKSQFALSFCNNGFTPSFIQTIGIDFRMKEMEIDGKRIKFQVWDTAGQERFRSITSAYYRNAHAILLMYDISDRSSFENLRSWKQNIDHNAQSECAVYLVAAHGHSATLSSVSSVEGRELAREFGIPFFECSTEEHRSVVIPFEVAARNFIQRLNQSSSVNPSHPSMQ